MRTVRNLIFVLIGVLGAAGVYAFFETTRPYKGFPGTDVLVEIPRGSSTSSIARQLTGAGVIKSPWVLWAARIFHPGARLQAGEYRFTRAETPATILERLGKGEIASFDLTIPEGHNLWDVAAAVGRLGFLKEADFLAVARSPRLIADLDPQAESLEGYLFPSTYRVTKKTTVEQLAKMMTDTFRREWKSLDGTANRNIHEIVTMASLVEKESGVPAERPVVSSVYWNRLRQGMRMECDPTTIYAAMLRGRWRGTIYKSDLENEHPYNTYKNKGLPPGPIANPGREAIRAALHPAETKYIYFVAKGDGSGGHNFAEGFSDHQRNVSSYRKNREGQ